MALPPLTKRNNPASTGGTRKLELALEESELRYRRLFETAQDGILILNAETGKIMDVNPFLLDLIGYPFESIIGLELWEIGLFEDIAANRVAFERLQKEEYIRYENHPLRKSDGKRIEVEFVSNVYVVGTDRVIQCNIRDISARAQGDERDDRINALEVASKARDEVLAVLSHELRTPLTAIASMIDLVELGQTTNGLPPETAGSPAFDNSAVAVIRRNVQSLSRLINELLDLSHFSKGSLRLDLEAVDAHEVIRFALKNLEQRQKPKAITLDLRLHAEKSVIQADALKLEQIISNLVGNALKFTPEGGRVSVLTRNVPGSQLIIEVQDNGIGIPPAALARIFAPFEQGDASIHARFGGLGLGLSIAHTLVAFHAGSLHAASEGIDRGAKFTADFNLAPAASKPLPKCAPRGGFRILLAEDNEDARRCLTALLESAGYEVSAAPDMKTALGLGDWRDFDLLVADLGLPDGTGAELLLKLRATTPTLPAIAISGYGMPQDILMSRSVGFFAHFVKPLQFTELKSAIQPLCEAKGASLA